MSKSNNKVNRILLRQLLEVRTAELDVQLELVATEKAKLAANGWFQDKHGN